MPHDSGSIWQYLNILTGDSAKSALAGEFIGAILYGIAIVLFFQTLNALLRPTKGMIKWGFVAHAVAMFSSLTISITVILNQLSISFIDDRGSVGPIDPHASSPPYQVFISTPTTHLVSGLTLPLNQWLADGLLLHRCYVIYGMSYLNILFPGFTYLATVVLGAVYIHKLPRSADASAGQTASPGFSDPTVLAYLSISLALNVLLTLMIIARLVWHRRLIRSATGAPSGVSGVYTTIAILLIESCAPYTIAFLLWMIPTNNYLYFTSFAALTKFQVIAPFFIIVRVATQRAVTSDMVTSGSVSSIRFRGQEASMSGSAVISAGNRASSMAHERGGAPNVLGVGGEVIIETQSVSSRNSSGG